VVVRSGVFIGVAVLLFVVCTAMTVAWCASMSTVGAMPMPGGWTLSMTWMRMPGQTWLGTAASFLAMWVVMMAAMMLPSLVPVLWRYRQTVAAAGTPHLGRLTVLAGAGYFAIWTVFGLLVFPFGIALAEIAMRLPAAARAVPIAVGAVVLSAGLLQFTAWKARRLDCCRETARCGGLDCITAWRHGMRLGLHCCCCCCGLTVSLLVIGVMDLRAMALTTAAVNLERLAGERAARAIGAAAMAAGLVMIARKAGLA
jgi:predicted metal-binding membrane protein